MSVARRDFCNFLTGEAISLLIRLERRLLPVVHESKIRLTSPRQTQEFQDPTEKYCDYQSNRVTTCHNL